MVLDWFNASEANKFGVQLAHFFMERIPPKDVGKKEKALAKRAEVIDKMFVQATQFKQQHKLNIYKKATLGNAFKWELNDAGYDSDFVDDLTKLLMTRL